MNPPTASSVNSIAKSFQAIVEVLANGQVATWVSEFQDSKVIAAVGVASRQENRTMAILELEKVLKKRLESIERVVIEVDSSRETLLLGQTLCYGEQNVQSIDTLPSIPADD